MAFVTASAMIFVQIGLTDSPCGQRQRASGRLSVCSPLLTIAVYVFARIASLLDWVVIVRIPSHPDDKANRQYDENEYNNYFRAHEYSPVC